jgi:hypothetical protein
MDEGNCCSGSTFITGLATGPTLYDMAHNALNYFTSRVEQREILPLTEGELKLRDRAVEILNESLGK